MAYNKLPLIDKLISKTTTQGDCIIFLGQKSRTGYGKLRIHGKLKSAHRIMYEIHHGEITSGFVVMHKCDNPSCINIEHLRLGSQAENIKDMHEKNRAVFNRGINHPGAKLTLLEANQIKATYKSHDRKNGATALSKYFGVHRRTIEHVIKNKHWTTFDE